MNNEVLVINCDSFHATSVTHWHLFLKEMFVCFFVNSYFHYSCDVFYFCKFLFNSHWWKLIFIPMWAVVTWFCYLWLYSESAVEIEMFRYGDKMDFQWKNRIYPNRKMMDSLKMSLPALLESTSIIAWWTCEGNQCGAGCWGEALGKGTGNPRTYGIIS